VHWNAGPGRRLHGAVSATFLSLSLVCGLLTADAAAHAQSVLGECSPRHETVGHQILRVEAMALGREDLCALFEQLDGFIDRARQANATAEPGRDLARVRRALVLADREEDYGNQQLLSDCLASGVCDCDTRSFKVISWAETAGIDLRAARGPGHLYLKLFGSTVARVRNIEPEDAATFCDGTEPFARRICPSIKRFSREISSESVRRGAFLRPLSPEELRGLAHSNAGVRLLELGFPLPALAQQDCALSLNPVDPLVRIRRAEAFLATNPTQLEEVRELLGESFKLDPFSPYAHILLGRMAHTEADSEAALAHFRRASVLGAQDDHLLVFLGEAYDGVGEPLKAAKAYKAALGMTRDDRLRQRIRAAIARPPFFPASR